MAAIAARLDALVPRPRPRRLLARFQSGYRLIDVADIVRFVAHEGLTYAVIGPTSLAVDDTLDALERRFDAVFVRTGRADLVALDRIDRLQSQGDGSAVVTLKDGTTLRVSRRRAADVWRAVGEA
jgi:DNA-binding LytR/AlgR family response regulator